LFLSGCKRTPDEADHTAKSGHRAKKKPATIIERHWQFGGAFRGPGVLQFGRLTARRCRDFVFAGGYGPLTVGLSTAPS
jgi:hypothetical protein